MSGNFAIKGGGGFGPLMANAILNFHFDFLHTSLMWFPKVDFSKTTKIEIRNIWKWLPNFPRWMLTIADAQLEDSGVLGSE